MFKKLNTKTLLILFGVLLLLVVITQWLKHRGGDRNFIENLVEVDTSKITAIYIKPKGKTDEITLKRINQKWEAVYKSKIYRVDDYVVHNILDGFHQFKPEQIVGTDKSSWKQYEVTDSAGVRIKVEENGKMKADFVVGRFFFQQNPQKMTTYVRLTGQDEVYGVDGYLSMTYNQTLSSLRNKTIGRGNAGDFSKVTVTCPADSSFVLLKEKNKWTINGNPADSSKVMNYLGDLALATSSDFVDDNAPLGNQSFMVKAEGPSGTLFEINAFAADTANKYIITSSVNPGAKFSGAKGNLLNRIFVSSHQFLVKQK